MLTIKKFIPPIFTFYVVTLILMLFSTACNLRGSTSGSSEIIPDPPLSLNGIENVNPAEFKNEPQVEQTSDPAFKPYCNPSGTGIWVVPGSTLISEGQEFNLDLFLKNDEGSEAFMGQIQYSLTISPKIISGYLGPIDSTVTLYPGESEHSTFRLRADSEGVVQIIGQASYELHALDVSWGSWTGCISQPVDLEVTDGLLGTTAIDLEVPIHNPSTRVGISEVDSIVNAILARDIRVIRSKIGWAELACTYTQGLGGPPKCQSNESEGTLVRVLPFLGPEGHFLREDEISSWPVPNVKGLYSIYKVSPKVFSEPEYPAGEYGLVFLHGHGVSFIIFQVSDGRIVRIDNEFGIPPDDWLLRNAETVILPPPEESK